MENNIRKFLIIESAYGCPVRISVLENLFGKTVVKSFLEENKRYRVINSWVGKADSFKNRNLYLVCEKKTNRARKLVEIFRFIPWVRFAAVSGSVSFGSAPKSSDIDLILVIAKNRLWIVRGLEVVIFSLIGVRRVMWRKVIKDKLCINYYVSENNLDLRGKKSFEFLSALELIMLKPVYNQKYYNFLLSKNRWIKKYFPNVKTGHIGFNNFPRIPIVSLFFDILDLVAMYLQIAFMKAMGHSMENSYISRNKILFFGKNREWEGRVRLISST